LVQCSVLGCALLQMSSTMALGTRRRPLLRTAAKFGLFSMTVGLAALRGPWGPSTAMAQAADAPGAAAVLGAYLVKVVTAYLPGLAIGALGYVLCLQREREGRAKILWYLAVALFAAMAVLGLLVVDAAKGTSHAPSQVQAQAPAPTSARLPHSGELVLSPDRSAFLRVADPRHPKGDAVEDGWQGQLWSSMASTIEKGEEQVVMVFTRQHCPWCEKLLPVLQRAIAKRAAAVADASPNGSGLLNAPLRIFIYDAQEFMPVVEQLKLEGFPTLIAYGRPGIQARMVPGYLGDEDFDNLIVEQALKVNVGTV